MFNELSFLVHPLVYGIVETALYFAVMAKAGFRGAVLALAFAPMVRLLFLVIATMTFGYVGWFQMLAESPLGSTLNLLFMGAIGYVPLVVLAFAVWPRRNT